MVANRENTVPHETEHPDRELLRAFLLGRMTKGEFAAIERHVEECSECAAVLEELDCDSGDEFATRLRDAARDFNGANGEEDLGAAENESSDLVGGLSGQQIGPNGRYELKDVLGAGGFGEVYKGWDKEIKRDVAIKIPWANCIPSKVDFLDEAKKLGGISRHSGIVQVHDCGELKDGRCFLVYEFIDGGDLSKHMREGFSPSAAVKLVAEIAEALAHIHFNGLVHRDVKPSNVLIDRSGKPLLADFGLAMPRQQFGSGQKGLMGTIIYMSPEQARGDADVVDGRSDIFSLGVILYELLAGVRPFRGSSEQVIAQLTDDTVTAAPLRQNDDGLPKELEDVCLKALAKQSDARYRTAQDFADALRRCVAVVSGPEQSPERSFLRNIPFGRNRLFVGREDMLDRLNEHLSTPSGFRGTATPQMQAVVGLGGVGKTQLVVEFAYRFGEQYQAVFWVRAETEHELRSSFVEIARLLQLPQSEDLNDAVQAVLWWLATNDRWLFIFDNANAPNLVKPFCPQDGHGSVIFTSRSSVWDMIGIVQPLQLVSLSDDESLQFLFKRTGRKVADESESERSAAADLVRELGGLPLGLEQAGAYLMAKQSRFTDYLRVYRRHPLALLDRSASKGADYNASVGKTWEMNLREVERMNPGAVEFLQACTLLAPDRIPLELFADGGSQWGEELSAIFERTGDDPLTLDELLAPLVEYSLVSRDLVGHYISMHRLVQEVLRGGMDTTAQEQWGRRVVLALNQVFPEVDYDAWPMCERLLPHAEAAASLIDQWGFRFAEAGRLLNETAAYLHHRGAYAEAEPLYKRALAIREESLGSDHPDVAISLDNLAVLYHAHGRYDEAEPMHERALAIRQLALGKHENTATSLDHLAELYRMQRRYSQAGELYRQALAMRQELLGDEHPDVATSLNNFASLYIDQRQFENAQPLLERAFAIRQKSLPDDHPGLATSLDTLAGLYRNLDRLEEAGSLYEQALAIREKRFGPDHPLVGTSLNNQAALFKALDDFPRAEQSLERARTIFTQALGPENTSVATTQRNLALLYRDQGDHDRAEPLFRQALASMEKVWGPKHHRLAKFLKDYATLLRSQSRTTEADELAARADRLRQPSEFGG